MSERIVFEQPSQDRLNANGWNFGLGQLNSLDIDWAGHGSDVARQEPDIEIDLSRTAFADFSALGRLLTLAAALTQRGVKLTVRMPSEKMFPDDLERLESAKSRVAHDAIFSMITRRQRQRANCRLFLGQSGFESALNTGPLAGKVRIPPAADEASSPVYEQTAPFASFDPTSQESYREPQRLRRVIPYRWVDTGGAADGNQIPGLSHVEQALVAMGLISNDATAITQGIFRELVENVANHSTIEGELTGYALLGACLVQPSAYVNRQQDFDDFMRTFTIRAAGELKAPILRLFVGDAGQGIQPSSNDSRLPEPEAVAKRIIAALDYHPPTLEVTGPRGLWKVKELVQSFQGSVIVSSRQAVAGYIFDPDERRENPNRTHSLPGTVVECNLLVGAHKENESPTQSLSFYPSLVEKSPAHLECYSALLISGKGIDPTDLEKIRKTLEGTANFNTDGIVISVEMQPGGASPNDLDIAQAIRQIYHSASEAAADALVAVVFAGVSGRLLTLAVLDFNLELDINARSAGAWFSMPMLIITDDNRHFWVGGSSGLRNALYQLSHSGRDESLDKINNMLRVDGAHRIEDTSPRLSRIVRIESGMVGLAFQPSHGISALTDYCARNLAHAAVHQNPANRTGQTFITPSLREVGVWIDTRSALHAAKCTRMAGFLMAAGIEATLQQEFSPIQEVQVIRIGSLEEELAATFTLSLTGHEQGFTFEELIGLRAMPLDTKRQVVVCTNIISNGASIRQAVRELWHLGFEHVAVAAIIDARDRSHQRDGLSEGQGYLVVYGKRVPLFALASVSVTVTKPETEQVFIDPIIRQPMPHRYPRSKTCMDQNRYMDAICRSGAARLGHIRRWSGRRHDSAYIDTAQLFSDTDWSKRAFQRMIKLIGKDSAQAGFGAETASDICVIYPGEPNEDLAYAAQRLVEALRAQFPATEAKQRVTSIPVPRAVMNGEWTFPRALDFPGNVDHIVAIDSGSRSGSTLRGLIRLAAQPQVRCISVFSLINGMSDLEALSLQEVASVRARAYDRVGRETQKVIPVNVQYLVRTAARAGGGSCAQCAVRDEYAALPRMSDSLERHRDWLLKMLEVRSRQSIFADTPADLYGMSIEQKDCIEYLRWRSFLSDAGVDTKSRLAVVEKITELANACGTPTTGDMLRRERDALVRVLAAESDRLNVAPLWFASVRSKVMTILWSLVSAPDSYAVDQALRVQAIVVLSRGDISGFSGNFARLVRDSADNDLVFRHALVEAVRLVRSSSGLPDWTDTLADQISFVAQEDIMQSDVQGNLSKARGDDIEFLAEFTRNPHSSAS